LVTIISDAGLKTPESVQFDKDRDVYLISNINGAPLDKDNNGFISRVTPQGELTLKFIEAGKGGVELNAPKGMVISGDVLYVADIDRVRRFEVMTGKPLGDIHFAGASFLNGLAVGKEGQIYVSDSGLNAEFAPTGTDAIYVIKEDKPKKLIASKSLGGPNGLIASDGGVWVSTFRSGELFWLSDDGKKNDAVTLPQGKNDGLVAAKDGRMFVSSWEGKSILALRPGEEAVVELSGVESPADIGYDCKRGRLLVPLFTKDTVVFHDLSSAPKKP
jgi:sugar lactone lactonase YvrE